MAAVYQMQESTEFIILLKSKIGLCLMVAIIEAWEFAIVQAICSQSIIYMGSVCVCGGGGGKWSELNNQ